MAEPQEPRVIEIHLIYDLNITELFNGISRLYLRSMGDKKKRTSVEPVMPRTKDRYGSMKLAGLFDVRGGAGA